MSQNQASEFNTQSFQKVSMMYYPPQLLVVPWIVIGAVAWYVATSNIGNFGPLIYQETGILGYLLLPVLMGLVIVIYGVFGAIKQMLQAHKLPFLVATMDFSEEEPPITIPFVGELVNAPSNIPGLTSLLKVKKTVNGQEVEEVQQPLSLLYNIFQADVYIPQPRFPFFWRRFKQPVDRMLFFSEGDLSTVNKKWESWVGYKRLLTTAANVLPLYLSLYRGRQYVQNEKIVPLFHISGSKHGVKQAQSWSKTRYLTSKEVLEVENSYRNNLAMEERVKREAAEAELKVMKQMNPNLMWKSGELARQRKLWEEQGFGTDAGYSSVSRWLKNRTNKWLFIIAIVLIAVVSAVVVDRLLVH